MEINENSNETLITLTADIVSAHVSNNSVAVNDLPTLIQNVHNALSGLGGRAEEPDHFAEHAATSRGRNQRGRDR